MKQDREVTNLRHDKEIRDAQLKAEEVFQKARAEESTKSVPLHKFESLNRSYTDAQDSLVNQKTVLEKKLRAAEESQRSAREEAEEAQNDLKSMERQHQHSMRDVESQISTLSKTVSDVRGEADSKSNALKATQDRLAQQEVLAGELESEILRLKAQTGDSDTLAIIKKELSEQMTHIRHLEKTNREQTEELKVFRKRSKAVEVVEEEKRVLESRLGLLDGTQKQLREEQLQRQILEDERRSWAAYIETEGSGEYSTPEDVVKEMAQQRLQNASLVQQQGQLQAEGLEKDEMIKTLESQRITLQSEVDILKSTTANPPSSATLPTTTNTTTTDTRTKQRLEKQLSFAKKEIALMRDQLRSFDTEEQTYHADHPFDAAKSARITDLERLLDDHRTELSSLTSQLSHQPQPIPPSPTNTNPNPLKRPHPPPSTPPSTSATAEDTSDLLSRLTRKTRTLQSQLSTTESSLTLLTAENTALKSQLASASTTSTRILALRSNPTADQDALKLATVRALRRENADLLSALSARSSSSTTSADSKHISSSSDKDKKAAGAMVPRSTLQPIQDRLAEREAELKEAQKRMQRLKQIWGAKAGELREAVLSLLGWRMEMRGDGKVVLALVGRRRRGASGRNEDEDEDDGEMEGEEGEERSFVFDGEKGTMKVSGGAESAFAREVKPFFREWVGGRERGWIPGLMASVLLGRAGREVG